MVHRGIVRILQGTCEKTGDGESRYVAYSGMIEAGKFMLTSIELARDFSYAVPFIYSIKEVPFDILIMGSSHRVHNVLPDEVLLEYVASKRAPEQRVVNLRTPSFGLKGPDAVGGSE